jgi:pyruvate formate lyase activating enzyme
MNDGGELIAFNYAEVVAMHLDPIEKKPLYHYHPGTNIFSLAPNSCNLSCSYCQNFEISQKKEKTVSVSPESLLDICLKNKYAYVAFTYTEPFTWYEYIYDCAVLFKSYDIKIVLVTNGYINLTPLTEIIEYIDAMNIDLKSISDQFYQITCKGKLEPVLNAINLAARHCHLEITNLIIPGLNDSEKEFADLADFISGVSKEIPLHFSRYFPMWKCVSERTPEVTLETAYSIAKEKLDYVYIGNTQSRKFMDTYCPECGSLVIQRSLEYQLVLYLNQGRCRKCGHKIYGIY